LKTKTNKSTYDDLLIKLFEASVRYSKFSKVSVQNLEELHLNYFESEFENIIDMAGMALWSDGKIEKRILFLYKLAEMIKIPDAFVTESIESTDAFITKHKSKIPYFNYSNPVIL
jgi:hypothetical protein